MSIRILSLMMLICALCFNVYSQKSADEAAKTGLNLVAVSVENPTIL